jgi:hypothetical protein
MQRRNAAIRCAVIRIALASIALAGCTPLPEHRDGQPGGVAGAWRALVVDIAAFERRIGFTPTPNFRVLAARQASFPFCGIAPRTVLPYSYQDPVIEWKEHPGEAACRAAAGAEDTWSGESEAVGESGTPMTTSMLASTIDRFTYVVIHENCHDQFELPHGIEEALCDVIAHRAMVEFGVARFGAGSAAARAMRAYAANQARIVRATLDLYAELEQLHARHDRREITTSAFLAERARRYETSRTGIDWGGRPPNNVGLASYMTYTRHYPFLDGVHDALGEGLATTVAFFREVDRRKPDRAAVLAQAGVATVESVAFIRANEEAVLATVRQLLQERGSR